VCTLERTHEWGNTLDVFCVLGRPVSWRRQDYNRKSMHWVQNTWSIGTVGALSANTWDTWSIGLCGAWWLLFNVFISLFHDILPSSIYCIYINASCVASSICMFPLVVSLWHMAFFIWVHYYWSGTSSCFQHCWVGRAVESDSRNIRVRRISNLRS